MQCDLCKKWFEAGQTIVRYDDFACHRGRFCNLNCLKQWAIKSHLNVCEKYTKKCAFNNCYVWLNYMF